MPDWFRTFHRTGDATKAMYGLEDELTAPYGRRCLMARRLIERGVCMVQTYIERQIWDQHNQIRKGLEYGVSPARRSDVSRLSMAPTEAVRCTIDAVPDGKTEISVYAIFNAR
jgi:hypothetical protein